jgi:hypothetical protein
MAKRKFIPECKDCVRARIFKRLAREIYTDLIYGRKTALLERGEKAKIVRIANKIETRCAAT